MRKCILLGTTGVFIFVLGMAWAQKPAVSTRQSTPVVSLPFNPVPLAVGSTVSLLRATPSTIPFTANNPGSSIAGGSVATVAWNITNGQNGRTWTLTVGATSSSFIGCATVPESAVSVNCTSASVTGGGQASAGCNVTNFTTLPTIPTALSGLTVASGNEGNASSHSYTVVLSYELADSWRYIANTCPLTVIYTVNAP